jgi:hypothetical protein
LPMAWYRTRHRMYNTISLTLMTMTWVDQKRTRMMINGELEPIWPKNREISTKSCYTFGNVPESRPTGMKTSRKELIIISFVLWSSIPCIRVLVYEGDLQRCPSIESDLTVSQPRSPLDHGYPFHTRSAILSANMKIRVAVVLGNVMHSYEPL